MVWIVGAGPGAPDLITVRGAEKIREADVIIYAGSLVNPKVFAEKKKDCRVYDSSEMTLEEVMDAIKAAEEKGLSTVRLHTGDPCVYGAVREQMDRMEQMGIAYEICPGVSSFCGAAAALSMEYTLPGVSQSVVLTRMAGRTPAPERESIAALAAHGATMVIFLSAGMLGQLSKELIEGGYTSDTPAAIVYKATWPDEKTVVTTVGSLEESGRAQGIDKTALIIVGKAVGQTGYARSSLYDPAFTTGFRKGTRQ